MRRAGEVRLQVQKGHQATHFRAAFAGLLVNLFRTPILLAEERTGGRWTADPPNDQGSFTGHKSRETQRPTLPFLTRPRCPTRYWTAWRHQLDKCWAGE